MHGYEERGDRVRSFLIGGLVGASALAAARRKRRRRGEPQRPAGLAAFEDAPCHRELVERERAAK